MLFLKVDSRIVDALVAHAQAGPKAAADGKKAEDAAGKKEPGAVEKESIDAADNLKSDAPLSKNSTIGTDASREGEPEIQE